MVTGLRVATGQHSDRGRKETNQDFHGAILPDDTLLRSKGVAIALADGISSSAVSQEASQVAVTSFLEDYYCTSEAWPVKTSAQRVLAATNSWLHAQTRKSHYRFDTDRGYVCTFSAMVIKSTTAHIFHVGDARIYRLAGNTLEQLTRDHRIWVSQEESHLSRALGINPLLEIDYQELPLHTGDIFLLATDGVHEHLNPAFLAGVLAECGNDLDAAAKRIVAAAYDAGSTDNLTVQIVRIEELPDREAHEVYPQATLLPFPPDPGARAELDGYRIVRGLHSGSRSHVYLAIDTASNTPAVIKTLATDLRESPAAIERFLMEEWIARRINSAHVLRPCPQTRQRNSLYVAMEFVEGRTLTQWMRDNPRPGVDKVRRIIEQIASGLRAFHRLEMLHQDLRPDNIMIDDTGTVKIIDFGSTRVAGICEGTGAHELQDILGTAQYTAPEYFLGAGGTPRSDLFSLGVIAYQMLTGHLPYGAEVARIRPGDSAQRLQYIPATRHDRALPAWIDETLRKAVHPVPEKRYQELSEFVFDLKHPNRAFQNRTRAPLIQRDPVAFWRGLSLLLIFVLLLMLGHHADFG